MSPSAEETPGNDWRTWLSLAWMIVFGVLYALMIVREKAPGLLARLLPAG